MTDYWYDFEGYSHASYYKLYKSKKGQYFRTGTDYIHLLSIEEVKKCLEDDNNIRIYKQEFGIEKG